MSCSSSVVRLPRAYLSTAAFHPAQTSSAPSYSQQHKGMILQTESIRVFAKDVGMLVAVRLAPSPLWEPVTSFRVLLLRVLLHHGRDTMHAPWATCASC